MSYKENYEKREAVYKRKYGKRAACEIMSALALAEGPDLLGEETNKEIVANIAARYKIAKRTTETPVSEILKELEQARRLVCAISEDTQMHHTIVKCDTTEDKILEIISILESNEGLSEDQSKKEIRQLKNALGLMCDRFLSLVSGNLKYKGIKEATIESCLEDAGYKVPKDQSKERIKELQEALEDAKETTQAVKEDVSRAVDEIRKEVLEAKHYSSITDEEIVSTLDDKLTALSDSIMEQE